MPSPHHRVSSVKGHSSVLSSSSVPYGQPSCPLVNFRRTSPRCLLFIAIIIIFLINFHFSVLSSQALVPSTSVAPSSALVSTDTQTLLNAMRHRASADTFVSPLFNNGKGFVHKLRQLHCHVENLTLTQRLHDDVLHSALPSPSASRPSPSTVATVAVFTYVLLPGIGPTGSSSRDPCAASQGPSSALGGIMATVTDLRSAQPTSSPRSIAYVIAIDTKSYSLDASSSPASDVTAFAARLFATMNAAEVPECGSSRPHPPLCFEVVYLRSSSVAPSASVPPSRGTIAAAIAQLPVLNVAGLLTPRPLRPLLTPLLCTSSACRDSTAMVFVSSPTTQLTGVLPTDDEAMHVSSPYKASEGGAHRAVRGFSELLERVLESRVMAYNSTLTPPPPSDCSALHHHTCGVASEDGCSRVELASVSLIGAVSVRRVLNESLCTNSKKCEPASSPFLPSGTSTFNLQASALPPRGSATTSFFVANAGHQVHLGMSATRSTLLPPFRAAQTFASFLGNYAGGSNIQANSTTLPSSNFLPGDVLESTPSLSHLKQSLLRFMKETVPLKPEEVTHPLIGARLMGVSLTDPRLRRLTRVAAVGVGTISQVQLAPRPSTRARAKPSSSSWLHGDSCSTRCNFGNGGAGVWAVLATDYAELLPSALAIASLTTLVEDAEEGSAPLNTSFTAGLEVSAKTALLTAVMSQPTTASGIWWGGGLAMSLAAAHKGVMAASGHVVVVEERESPAIPAPVDELLHDNALFMYDAADISDYTMVATSVGGAVLRSLLASQFYLIAPSFPPPQDNAPRIAHTPTWGSVSQSTMHRLSQPFGVIATMSIACANESDYSTGLEASVELVGETGLPGLFGVALHYSRGYLAAFLSQQIPNWIVPDPVHVTYETFDLCAGITNDASHIAVALLDMAPVLLSTVGGGLCPGLPFNSLLSLRRGTLSKSFVQDKRHIDAPDWFDVMESSRYTARNLLASTAFDSSHPFEDELKDDLKLYSSQCGSHRPAPRRARCLTGQNTFSRFPESSLVGTSRRLNYADYGFIVPQTIAGSLFEVFTYVSRLRLFGLVLPAVWSDLPQGSSLVFVNHRVPNNVGNLRDFLSVGPRGAVSLGPFRKPDVIIARAMFELTRVPTAWLKTLRPAHVLWVPSQFCVDSFTDTGFRQLIQIVPLAVDPYTFTSRTPILPLRITSSNMLHEFLQKSSWSMGLIGRNHEGNSAKSLGLRDQIRAQPFVFISIWKYERRKGWDHLIQSFVSEFCLDNPVWRPILIIVTYRFGGPPGKSRRPLFFVHRFLRHLVNFATIEQCNLYQKVVVSTPEEVTENIKKIRNLRTTGRAATVNENYFPLIYIITRHLSGPELMALTLGADAYAATHRGEGWGFPIHESMALGLPALGTNFSGNIEFMNSVPLLPPSESCEHNFYYKVIGNESLLWYDHARTAAFMGRPLIGTLQSDVPAPSEWPCTPISLLFPCTVPKVEHAIEINWVKIPGGLWAEPDDDGIRRAMRFFVSHPEWRDAIAKAGQKHVTSKYSEQSVAHVALEQIDRSVRACLRDATCGRRFAGTTPTITATRPL